VSSVPSDSNGPQTGSIPQSYKEHAPYAAKACDACHDRAATNALIVPKEELCARCHEIEQDVKYVHGPIASGGCLVCHDPHRSRYDALLVSEAAGFCFRCHDREALSKIDEHASPDADCTACHNAHGSDHKFLLR
jgi:predicted CXXCH cytochrome family protein